MEYIWRIVRQRQEEYGSRIYIIEDASHALGSSYKGCRVGSCKYSDMAVMSFHPVKHITTGEGGAVFTNDEELFRICVVAEGHRPPQVVSQPQRFQ